MAAIEPVSVKAVTVLHIDDDPAQRYAVGRILTRAGYTVWEGATGADALRLAARGPDLILLDVQLPDINGVVVCQRLKEDPATASIPVLQISALAVSSADRARGLEEGADAYLVHPIDPAVLLATVKALLRVRHAEQALRREVEQRRATEQSLAREKERLAVTLQSIADGVITTDSQGRVDLMNAVAERLTGMGAGAARGRPLAEVFALAGTNDIGRDVNRPTVLARASLRSQDGAVRVVTASAAPIRDAQGQGQGSVVVFRDITERQKLEDEVIKAQKLESIGVLAGGIAHDFNNILTAILGNISLARLTPAPADELLSEAELACQRARELTQQLLTFAKGGAPIKKTASIGPLLDEAVALALRGSPVRCKLSLAADLWPLEMDAGQIAQALNNLIINAKEAMPDGGTLHVSAENRVIDDSQNEGQLQGHYVCVTLRDEGIGIGAEHLPKIFDPYFTTKQKGTGLGLTTTYSIVRRHGGHIEAESRRGVGTTFVVYLPAAAEMAEPVAPSAPELVRGSGRVLLMDDERAIREYGSRLLTSLGYEVECVVDGRAAIMAYEGALQAEHGFDVVILDLTVRGGMGGRACLDVLRQIDPQVRALVSSGYATDPVMSNPREHGFVGVIPKPYEPQELSRVLAATLDERPAADG